MKSLLLVFFLVTLNICHGQHIENLTFECLDDLKSGGMVFQPDTSSYPMKMAIKTYGPCNVDFKVIVREIEQQGNITNLCFDIYDKKKSYQGGKLECGCMYKLQFTIANYKLKSNFRGWMLNNQIMPKSVWEEWYWNNLD